MSADAKPASSTDPVGRWLTAAAADADRRGLPELKPLLESLAAAIRTLRSAQFGGSALPPT
jgi:hypothetical protein